MHRDLKPENIMLEKDQNRLDAIKIIDFGFSKHFEAGEIQVTKCGTMSYTAPDVMSGSYNERCDIWSCGVIAYVLVSGVMPSNENEPID